MITAPTSPTPPRDAQRVRARAAWADLHDRLATVTPAALGRTALTTVVLAAVIAAVGGTWPALLPFAIGALLAYAVLPVVDGLAKVMPRALAALVSMLAILILIGTVIVTIVPPLVSSIVGLSLTVPAPDEVDGLVDEVLGGLAPETREIAGPILVAVADAIKDGLASASDGLRDVLPVAFQAALGVAGAILGLIVLPTWLLTLLTNKGRARVGIDRRLAGWLRPDFWAIVRMADRAAGTYLRGYVVVAFVVGLLTWVGASLSPQVGGPEFPSALALATFAGAMQVIPELGPILGLSPALLAVLSQRPEQAAAYVVIYLVARWLGGSLIGGRLVEGRLGIHPAILIPGVVVLSQVGPLALLLSAPILAFGSDLVRYLHGRLSEPPRPAGVLPGAAVPVSAPVGAAPVPVAYRGRAARAASAPGVTR